MITTDIHTFLIEYNNTTSKDIVSLNINSLQQLANSLRTNEGRKITKVRTFDRNKNRFERLPMERFKMLVNHCTDLNILLEK